MEYMGLEPNPHSRFNFTVFAPSGKVIQERSHPVKGQIGVLARAETAWQQRAVEGGCEAYVFFSVTGRPLFEEKLFYKGVDKVQPWLAININDCMVKVDKILLRTMEPLEVPDLPKAVRPEKDSTAVSTGN